MTRPNFGFSHLQESSGLQLGKCPHTKGIKTLKSQGDSCPLHCCHFLQEGKDFFVLISFFSNPSFPDQLLLLCFCGRDQMGPLVWSGGGLRALAGCPSKCAHPKAGRGPPARRLPKHMRQAHGPRPCQTTESPPKKAPCLFGGPSTCSALRSVRPTSRHGAE